MIFHKPCRDILILCGIWAQKSLKYKTMPELPEVETTIRSLNRTVRGLRIVDVWSSYDSSFHHGKNNIKDVGYFKKFRKAIIGKKMLSAERVAKNIIINLSGGI